MKKKKKGQRGKREKESCPSEILKKQCIHYKKKKILFSVV
jgi:hypothetical protein